MNTVKFSEIRLCTWNGDLNKKWFVYFECKNTATGEIKHFQFRGDINLCRTKKERLREAGRLIAHWKEEIKHGWSPFAPAPEISVPNFSNMRFNEALDFALSKCTLAKKSLSCYRTTVNFFKRSAERLLIHRMAISLIKRQHIKLILEDIKSSRNWSNKAYNKHVGYIGAIMSQLVEWEVIEYNPAHKIKTLKVAETQKYVPYTEDEKKRIREYLYLNHYRFFIILNLLYQTGIRPKEILSLKVKDFENNSIVIKPDLSEENSKTKKIRVIPLNQHILPFMQKLELERFPKEFYIFGSPFEQGKGNKGSTKNGRGMMHPDYFKPSPVMIKRDTVTKFWKKNIIDKLGINKYFYSGKHTGANAKILAGISLDALQEIYGHSSKLMTQKYATAVKEVYKKELLEKSPEF